MREMGVVAMAPQHWQDGTVVSKSVRAVAIAEGLPLIIPPPQLSQLKADHQVFHDLVREFMPTPVILSRAGGCRLPYQSRNGLRLLPLAEENCMVCMAGITDWEVLRIILRQVENERLLWGAPRRWVCCRCYQLRCLVICITSAMVRSPTRSATRAGTRNLACRHWLQIASLPYGPPRKSRSRPQCLARLVCRQCMAYPRPVVMPSEIAASRPFAVTIAITTMGNRPAVLQRTVAMACRALIAARLSPDVSRVLLLQQSHKAPR